VIIGVSTIASPARVSFAPPRSIGNRLLSP
jgi:hypothetical protein